MRSKIYLIPGLQLTQKFSILIVHLTVVHCQIP